jgi:hypothetical protein
MLCPDRLALAGSGFGGIRGNEAAARGGGVGSSCHVTKLHHQHRQGQIGGADLGGSPSCPECPLNAPKRGVDAFRLLGKGSGRAVGNRTLALPRANGGFNAFSRGWGRLAHPTPRFAACRARLCVHGVGRYAPGAKTRLRAIMLVLGGVIFEPRPRPSPFRSVEFQNAPSPGAF